jgi:hypothetical protein
MLVKLLLDIPSDIYHRYVSQAGKGEVEDLISDRLTSCVDHTAAKGLYLNDPSRRSLEVLLGRNFNTADDLVESVRKLAALRFPEVEIALQPQLLTRLKTRCFGKPFPEFLKERVVKGLEEYTMMG